MIVVTGGTGLLGSHLIYQLVCSGSKVRVIHRKSSDLNLLEKVFGYYSQNTVTLLQNVEWFEADLMDITAVTDALNGARQVYHCAAIVSFEGKKAGPMLHFNPETTANVVNAALANNVEKLVYASSVAALGRKESSEYIDEQTEWVESKHNSAYAKSKYLAELEVWRGFEEGLKAAIVNPSIILGPGNWKQGSSAIFDRIARGFKYYTLGTNGFVDVRDVVQSMILLMNSNISGERFVVVSENLSYKLVFSWIAEEMGLKKPSVEVQPWMSALLWRLEKLRTTIFGGKPFLTRETARTAQNAYFYDNGKIRNELDLEFRLISESVKDFSRLYQKDFPS